jgi:hypothetical protein
MENDSHDMVWKFKDIVAHEGPLKPTDPSYNGSPYNVLVVLKDQSRTYKPLHIIGADCPVVCAAYGKQNGLLDKPKWQRFKASQNVRRKCYA